MSPEALLGGNVRFKRSSDFVSVFQHDTVIRPVDCGGPIVDLSGKVIGINIVRGRVWTETYALPAGLRAGCWSRWRAESWGAGECECVVVTRPKKAEWKK